MSSRERLDNYLMQIAKIFTNNIQKVNVNNNFITRFTDKITDREIEIALKNPSTLNEIVRMLIKKISENSSEPDWYIVNSNNKQFFIPSDEAIEKYDIIGPYYNDDFKIEPLSQKSRFGFFQGGKKSKRRRQTKSGAKQRGKRRTKKSTCKKSSKK
jgi:hypothetical protein